MPISALFSFFLGPCVLTLPPPSLFPFLSLFLSPHPLMLSISLSLLICFSFLYSDTHHFYFLCKNPLHSSEPISYHGDLSFPNKIYPHHSFPQSPLNHQELYIIIISGVVLGDENVHVCWPSAEVTRGFLAVSFDPNAAQIFFLFVCQGFKILHEN